MAKTPPRKVAVKKKAPAPQVLSSKLSPDEAAREYETLAQSPYFRDTLGVKQSVLPNYMGENSTYGYYDPKLNFIAFNPDQPVEDAPSGGPLAGDRTPRQVLTHEGAHALDSKDKFPSYYSVNRPTFRVPLGQSKGVKIADALKSPSVQRIMPDKSVDQLNMQDKTSVQPQKLMGILPFGTAYKPMPQSEVAAIQALDPYYSIGGLRQNGLGELYAVTNPDESFAQAFTNAAGFLSETGSDTTGYREKLGRYEGNTPGAGAIVRDLFVGNPIYKNHPLKGLIR